MQQNLNLCKEGTILKNLIVYTTKYGSVEKSSKKLKEHLQGETTIINLKTETVPDIRDFDRIILGGSIYLGKVQKQLTKFACENERLLLKKKIGLFVNSGKQNKKKDDQLKNSFPEKLYDNAVVTGLFGDEITIEKCSFMDKLALRIIKKVTISYSNIDDRAIKKFADILNDL